MRGKKKDNLLGKYDQQIHTCNDLLLLSLQLKHDRGSIKEVKIDCKEY